MGISKWCTDKESVVYGSPRASEYRPYETTLDLAHTFQLVFDKHFILRDEPISLDETWHTMVMAQALGQSQFEFQLFVDVSTEISVLQSYRLLIRDHGFVLQVLLRWVIVHQVLSVCVLGFESPFAFLRACFQDYGGLFGQKLWLFMVKLISQLCVPLLVLDMEDLCMCEVLSQLVEILILLNAEDCLIEVCQESPKA